MRKFLFALSLVLVGSSCTNTEIMTKASVHELAANQLRKEGYSVKYVKEQDILLISSSMNLNDMSLKLNEIYEQIGHSEHKLSIIDSALSTNARTQGVTCSQSGTFYGSGGAICINYLCIADSSFDALWYYDCYNGTCYSVQASCH